LSSIGVFCRREGELHIPDADIRSFFDTMDQEWLATHFAKLPPAEKFDE
jgi:hypothetical protein